jgi:hypothetical protein
MIYPRKTHLLEPNWSFYECCTEEDWAIWHTKKLVIRMCNLVFGGIVTLDVFHNLEFYWVFYFFAATGCSID